MDYLDELEDMDFLREMLKLQGKENFDRMINIVTNYCPHAFSSTDTDINGKECKNGASDCGSCYIHYTLNENKSKGEVMTKIISRKNRFGDFINEITEYLDKYLLFKNERFNTYIYNGPIDNKWVIRFPGASRGYVEVIDGKVTNIKLDKDTCFEKLKCYKESVLENLDQFIGREIDL